MDASTRAHCTLRQPGRVHPNQQFMRESPRVRAAHEKARLAAACCMRARMPRPGPLQWPERLLLLRPPEPCGRTLLVLCGHVPFGLCLGWRRPCWSGVFVGLDRTIGSGYFLRRGSALGALGGLTGRRGWIVPTSSSPRRPLDRTRTCAWIVVCFGVLAGHISLVSVA